MNRRLLSRLALVMLFGSLVSVRANAAPIVVTSGFMDLYWDSCCGGFGVQGPGFSMGVVDRMNLGAGIGAFKVGTIVDSDYRWLGTGRGWAELDGARIQNPADPDNLIYFGGDLFFDAAPFVVQDADPAATWANFSTSFTMSGVLAGYSNYSRQGPALFTVDLLAQGTMTLTGMRRIQPGDSTFYPIYADRVMQFEPPAASPVPEPATWIYCSTAIAALVARRRRPSRYPA
jgi:hypothetical protein